MDKRKTIVEFKSPLTQIDSPINPPSITIIPSEKQNDNKAKMKGELDWFDFEQRVRRIIADILLPVSAS